MSYLYQMRAGKDRVGSKHRSEKERQRETKQRSERWSVGEIWKRHELGNDRWKRTPEYFK
jgi:hypothetical protein